MGMFSSIKNAIFGDKDDDKGKPGDGVPKTSIPRAKPAANSRPTPAPAASPKPVSQVDVAARLDAKPGADKLNWRTSIVDLMKLIGLDPSYDNRKELAQEMGRTDYEGTADDNVWLHRVTMQRLAQNGGKVPAEYLD
ncbi:MAG: DUF3597 domain-containing protein [Pontixanthobacter sp.]